MCARPRHHLPDREWFHRGNGNSHTFVHSWPQGSVPTEAPSVEKAGNLAVAQATTLLVCDTKGICLMLGPAILIFDIT